jgi:sigma-B regulation protein RsbU (phosphoserine phosphatase)
MAPAKEIGMSDKPADTAYLLRNLMETIPDNIYFKDINSHFIMVNKAYCDWTGMSSEQVVGKSDFDLFSKEHALQAYADEQKIIESGEPLFPVEEKETWPDGRVTWVSSTKMPLQDAGGKIIGTFGLSRDITTHKEARLRAAHYADEIWSIKEEMEEDVRMAAELQKTFFPRTYPSYPSHVPAGESCVEFAHYYRASGLVSGDFCTIRRLSESESAVFLFDVMGHGVRAALGTALICAMIEDILSETNDPGSYLARLNGLLFPILRQQDAFLYATACCMVFDAETGQLRMANAGHPIPLHFRPRESKVEWLKEGESLRGPALAIDVDADFPVLETRLHSGDAVVMYTDGLFEVCGTSGEEFGERGLRDAAQRMMELPLATLFPGLVEKARNFAAQGGLDDDVCLVGLRYKNPMPRENAG